MSDTATKKKTREICLVVTCDKTNVVQDAQPYTALLTAIENTNKKLSYNVVARNIREEGYYMDGTNPTKNIYYFKKPLVKSEYEIKEPSKKRIKNLTKKSK